MLEVLDALFFIEWLNPKYFVTILMWRVLA